MSRTKQTQPRSQRDGYACNVLEIRTHCFIPQARDIALQPGLLALKHRPASRVLPSAEVEDIDRGAKILITSENQLISSQTTLALNSLTESDFLFSKTH